MKTIDQKLKDIEIALLQLQRSALIDTQAIMQIMLDKGLCTLEDILDTRSRIEDNSPDVKRIDDQIVSCGGTVVATPSSDVHKSSDSTEDQLRLLKELLKKVPD